MIKDFNTYINEGLFDRNQSEFNIRKNEKGIEQVYTPKTRDDLCEYIKLDIEQAKKDGTYPNVNLNNIDVSELGDDELNDWFTIRKTIREWFHIIPDISNWDIKYIPNKFFDGNEQIKEFTIPNSVTSIGDDAFSGCNGLTSVTIGNSVTRIGSYAFAWCSSLTSVTIPNSVTNIGRYAFYNCSCLKSISIPNNVTNIRYGAFADCISLISVTIPSSVTSIGSDAFLGCRSLSSIEIPNSVTIIRKNAFSDSFRNCSGLTSVTISKHCHIEINSFPKNCKITRRDD